MSTKGVNRAVAVLVARAPIAVLDSILERMF